MFQARHAVALIAAIFFMPCPSAAAGVTGHAGASFIGGAAISQDFEGTITQIAAKAIVIDGVSFPCGWLVNPDIAPVPLENFSVGDHVVFQVDKKGMIVKMHPMASAAKPDRQRKFTRERLPGKSGHANTSLPAVPPRDSKPASAPARSAPIQQQNGVWTN